MIHLARKSLPAPLSLEVIRRDMNKAYPFGMASENLSR